MSFDNFDNKDWLKFALELYEKTKDMGITNNWRKEGLESLIEAARKLDFSGRMPAQAGKEEKTEKEFEKAGDDGFWQQDSGPLHGGTFASGAAQSGYPPPISIYETVRQVNVHVILPGISSREDVNIFLSQEAIELYGIKSAGGFSGGVKANENFYKLIRLPAPVEPSAATATYRNGFLYISAPKKSPPSPLKIMVEFE